MTQQCLNYISKGLSRIEGPLEDRFGVEFIKRAIVSSINLSFLDSDSVRLSYTSATIMTVPIMQCFRIKVEGIELRIYLEMRVKFLDFQWVRIISLIIG